MYTQCPECETTFKLGADDLRRAKGKVRCGDCNAVFNALDYLAEEVAVTAETASDIAAGWTSSAANPSGDVHPDLDEYETSAFTDVPYTGADDGEDQDYDDDSDDEDGGAILYIGDDDDAEGLPDPDDTDDSDFDDTDDSEFDDAVWESIPGVGADARHDAEDAADTAEFDETSALGPREHTDENSDDLEFNVPADKWTNFFGPLPKGQVASVWRPPALATDDQEQNPGLNPASNNEAHANNTAESSEAASDDAWTTLAAGSDDAAAALGGNIDEHGNDPDTDQDEADDDAFTPVWKEPQQRSALARFTPVGVTLLALLFVTQLIHYNRDSLAANPEYGATLRSVYAKLGSELYPLWNVNDYEIRGSEAIAGETGVDILDIRAQIANIGEHPSGLPRLRVVLRDRWANPVAAQDFGPGDYADTRSLPDDRLLQPGDVIGAHVSIQDPGSGAQGFELELCLPRRDTGLECTGQPFK